MRRCKYFEKESWCYLDLSNQVQIASSIKCLRGQMYFLWDGVSEVPCQTGNAPCYTPVEIDSYWKDIFDETNKRLYKLIVRD